MFIPRNEIYELFTVNTDIKASYKKEQKNRNHDFASFQNQLLNEFEDKILDICRDKLSDFTRIEASFSKFFDQGLLSDVLDTKADREQIHHLDISKADRREFTVIQ